jgi:hypothetical protein
LPQQDWTPTGTYQQALSPEVLQALAVQHAQQVAAQEARAGSGDTFLDAISPQSLEVLHHFGPEAAHKLNTYACSIEDALIESLLEQRAQAVKIGELANYVREVIPVLEESDARNQASQRILTEPGLLSEYVAGFFGPDGPFPTQTPAEQAQAALREGLVSPTGPLMPRSGQSANMTIPEFRQQGAPAAAPSYQGRPQGAPMPTPGSGGGASPFGNAQEAWGLFGQAMDAAPWEAWKVLDAMGPEALRSKVLFIDQ